MGTNLPTPKEFITAHGHAYYRDGDELGCAPLFKDDEVDWESSTIVEECPESDRDELRRVLHRLGFDPDKAEQVLAGIGWY